MDKPILLAVYEDVRCKDGVKIDIEYKVFDSLKSPVEIATCLVDDGSTEFSLNLKYKTKSGSKKSVSTLHVVFPFASIERFAYFLIDRAIKKGANTNFGHLPFWVSPVQVRIIACDKDSVKDAKKLTEELNSLNFRVDLDERNIHYSAKRKAEELKWIPYIITVDKNNKNLQNLTRENKIKGTIEKNVKKSDLINEIKTEDNRDIIVKRYIPMLLSERVF